MSQTAVVSVIESYGAPEGSCPGGDHVSRLGVCIVCGEWLPTGVCFDCTWRAEPGEATLKAAVAHHVETHHMVRVVVG